MASTSSLGAHSKTSASQAQRFYDDFNRVLAGECAVDAHPGNENADQASPPLPDVRARIEQASEESELHTIFEDVSPARTALTESTEELPSYDRQTHELVRFDQSVLAGAADLLSQRAALATGE